MTEPALLVWRSGLGDCSRHFEVRVWTAPFEEVESVRSQLVVAVQHALAAAQYEIHLRDGENKCRQESGDGMKLLPRWYLRIVRGAPTGLGKLADTVAMRKLLTILNAMLRDRRPWQIA